MFRPCAIFREWKQRRRNLLEDEKSGDLNFYYNKMWLPWSVQILKKKTYELVPNYSTIFACMYSFPVTEAAGLFVQTLN